MHPSDEDTGASVEMPRYRSHKQVWALEIDSVTHQREERTFRLTFRDPGYAPISAPQDMFARYMPSPGDFYVVYDDGYKSFSPAKAFKEGYTLIDRAAEMRRAFTEGGEAVQRKQRDV